MSDDHTYSSDYETPSRMKKSSHIYVKTGIALCIQCVDTFSNITGMNKIIYIYIYDMITKISPMPEDRHIAVCNTSGHIAYGYCM